MTKFAAAFQVVSAVFQALIIIWTAVRVRRYMNVSIQVHELWKQHMNSVESNLMDIVKLVEHVDRLEEAVFER